MPPPPVRMHPTRAKPPVLSHAPPTYPILSYVFGPRTHSPVTEKPAETPLPQPCAQAWAQGASMQTGFPRALGQMQVQQRSVGNTI